MRRRLLWLLLICCAGSAAPTAPVAAEEGLIVGLTGGVAAPVGRFDRRAKVGGVGSPFVGYMFLDYIGLVGEAQVVGFDAKFNPNGANEDIWALGGVGGPRLVLPFHIAEVPLELHGTWAGGVFTGLNGDTPISRTSWGYSTGGGIDVRLGNDFLVGLFTRYNWLDQRTEPGEDVQYITGGLSLAYNAAPPPPRPEPAPPAPEPVAVAPVVQKKIVLRGVNFDFGSAAIREDARPVLDEAVDTLQHEAGVVVLAAGHTDDVGSDAANLRLSQRRADAVRQHLIDGGIAPGRIRATGLGESQPVASNGTAEGRAENRRVELRIEGE